jgi:hypothetical protein
MNLKGERVSLVEENGRKCAVAVTWKREEDGKTRKARGRESKLNIAGRMLHSGES